MSFPEVFFAVVFILCNLSGLAQEGKGSLTGFVKDSLNKPVAYATISLFKDVRATVPVTRTYVDSKGSFTIRADTGEYKLLVTYAGLSDVTISVNIKTGEAVMEDIIMGHTPSKLRNITITTRKPLIEQGDDRITYNVESDPAAKSETATDILRKTPFVTVDGDGNVQVNGQTNFKVLLNGRETSVFALNVKEALKNFPGAVISKIEVITSPSAKYDAEGVGGVINIITRKKVIGYNGYISSYYSTLTNYSENVSLNMKSGRVGISAFAGANGIAAHLRGKSSTETVPFSLAPFSKRTLDGNRVNDNDNITGNLEIGYDIDSLRTITAYAGIGMSKSYNQLAQSIITERRMQPAEFAFLTQENTSENPNNGFGADFIQKFRTAPEKEFSIRINTQFSKNRMFVNSFQDNSVQDRYVLNESKAKNRESTLQADFVQPLKEKQKLETGAKVIVRQASSNFQSLLKYSSNDSYRLNPSNTDRFNYHQEVYSAYASYSVSIKKLSVRTGLRAEHTSVYGDFESAKAVVKQQYTNLVPNLLLTKKITSVYSASFSYNLRLQRPYITNLNPFVNNNDSLNISYGNPNLGSQMLHAVSLQNRLVKGKVFAAVTLNASYTNNMIVQYAVFDVATGVTSVTSANLGREVQTSINTSLNAPVGGKLTVGLGTQLRYNRIENKAKTVQQREGLSGSAFGNFYYKVVGKFTISGSGGVIRSPYALVNSPSSQAFYQVNFGYKWFGDKMSATMNVNNFHNRWLQFRTSTEDDNFKTVTTSSSPYRVLYFGVTYNFGKLKDNVSRKKGINNDDLVQ